jgi:hypothetical protein
MPEISSSYSKSAPELEPTQDGSLSLFHPQLQELYHNRAGAYLEASLNYAIPARQLLEIRGHQGSLRLLDACFGLGYNSLVFYEQVKSLGLCMQITAVDNDAEVLALLPKILEQICFADIRGDIEKNSCLLEILQEDLRVFLQAQCVEQHAFYDLIFHDAFSPRKVPELWSYELFSCYFQILKPGGALLTYSSASAVRGALLDCGFYLLRTQAVGGKPAGIIAIKPEHGANFPQGDLLALFLEDQRQELKPRGQLPYRDRNMCNSREAILQLRQDEQAKITETAKCWSKN